MIPQDRFCNKLRELGYSFQRQADRVMIYRKKGSTDRCMVPRKELLDNDYVRNALKQAGCDLSSIEVFVANNKDSALN